MTFYFEQSVITDTAPTIDTALEFEQLESTFDEDFIQTIEHNALVHAKMSVEKMTLYKKPSMFGMKILYVDAEEEASEDNERATGDEMALSIHSAAFDEVDDPESNKDVADVIINTSSKNEPEENNNINHDAQEAADLQNEEMSMIDIDHNDIYLFSAAATTGGSEDQLHQIPEPIKEFKEEHEEFNDEVRVTDYARENLSADKMFANTIDSNYELEEEDSTSDTKGKGENTNLDDVDLEPHPEDRELEHKFTPPLFTIYEESEEDQQLDCDVLETAGHLSKPEAIDASKTTDSSSMASPKLAPKTNQQSPKPSNVIDTWQPAESVATTAVSIDLPTNIQAAAPEAAKPTVENDETTLTLARVVHEATDSAGSNISSPAIVDDKDSEYCDTDTRASHHTDVLDSYLAEHNCSVPSIQSDARPEIIDGGFTGPIPACFELPTVHDRVTEEEVENGAESPLSESANESSSSAFEAPTTTVSEATSTPSEPSSPTTTKIDEAEVPTAKVLDVAIEALSTYDADDDSFDIEEFAAAIDAALLVFPTEETDMDTIDRGAITSAIDRLLQMLPTGEPSSDTEPEKDVKVETETLIEHHHDAVACDAAPEIQPAAQKLSSTEDDILPHLSLPEISMTHEESMLEA
ncbi:MAG: hypothetical protein STHCBS139747_007337 [Sporothrix thermara]